MAMRRSLSLSALRGNARSWLRGGIILAIAALIAAPVLCVSVAGVLRGSRPALALKWMPADAEAGANLASLVVNADSSPEVRAQARAAAIAALESNPMAVAAFRALGTAADAEGNSAMALRYYSASERLSRRDQATQAWFILYDFRRGAPEQAVHHFDIALRTSRERWDTLLPLLVRLSSAPTMVRPLRRLAETRPPWWPLFAANLVSNGEPLNNVVALTHGLLDASNAEGALLTEILLARLVAANRIDLAWRLYAEQRPRNPRPGALRDGGFEQTGGLTPFDWQLAQETDLSAMRTTVPGQGTVLSYSASEGRTGEAARQLVRLPPGPHRFQFDSGQIPAERLQRPHLLVRCADEAAQVLLDLQPQASGQSRTRVAARFVVPANCPWQWVVLRVSDLGSSNPDTPWIDNIAIAPAP